MMEMPKLNERNQQLSRLETTLTMYIHQLVSDFELTDAEVLYLLSSVSKGWAKFVIRVEREMDDN